MKTTNTASPKEANKVSGNNSGKNKEAKYVAMGVGFVKTRMAAWKVQKIIDSMEDIAESLDVELELHSCDKAFRKRLRDDHPVERRSVSRRG